MGLLRKRVRRMRNEALPHKRLHVENRSAHTISCVKINIIKVPSVFISEQLRGSHVFKHCVNLNMMWNHSDR